MLEYSLGSEVGTQLEPCGGTLEGDKVGNLEVSSLKYFLGCTDEINLGCNEEPDLNYSDGSSAYSNDGNL